MTEHGDSDDRRDGDDRHGDDRRDGDDRHGDDHRNGNDDPTVDENRDGDGTDGRDGEGIDGRDGDENPHENRSRDQDEEDRHDWPVVESRVEYETGWYTGGYDRVVQPDGTEKNYYWADLPAAVVVVAVADDEVVMVEQFRPTIREHNLELVAGIVEDGESYTDAGARELREEAGFDPAGVSLLAEFWCATGVLRHRRGIVFAEGLEPTERLLDSNEFIRVRSVPVDEALERAREPPANDATIEGILLAKEEGLL